MRVRPAMEADTADQVWSLDEIGNMKFLLFLIPGVIPASYEDVVV